MIRGWTTIDVGLFGESGLAAAYVVSGRRTALIDAGSRLTAPTTLAALAANGVDTVDWIVLTHVHLDHAGGADALAQAFPRARVAVHPRGARHLVDPSRLWAGVVALYGASKAQRLWGGAEALDPRRVAVLEDGEEIDLGGRSLRAIDTPGHARHHHSYLDSATGAVFCGDVLGVKLPAAEGLLRPAALPPEFDWTATTRSLDRLAALRPTTLLPTHYGATDRGRDPLPAGDAIVRARERIDRWRSLALSLANRHDREDRFVEGVLSAEGQDLGAEDWRRLDLVSPLALNAQGIFVACDNGRLAGGY